MIRGTLAGFILTVVAASYIGYIGAEYSFVSYNISCPEGWSKALNNCYYFNNVDILSWDEARTECALQDSDLLVVGSKAEMDWVNIQTESYNTDGWWVGLRHTAHWEWVQYGGDRTLIHWRNEPDNYDEQHCCAINEYGEFSDEFCRSKLGFICSYGVSRGEFCPDPDSWYLIDNACYYVSPLMNTSLHLDWKAAQSYCSNLVPGKNCQLLSLYDNNDKNGLLEFVRTVDRSGIMLPWWTGLNDVQTHGKYVWQNGTEADGTLITWVRSPDPDPSKNRKCGLMYQGGSIQDTVCNKRAHYACERSAVQAHLNLGCRSGWLRGGHSCYLLGNNKGYTWDQAKQVCSDVNAHLLRVDDLDEKAWVEGLPLNVYGYWTSLKRSSDPSGWQWDGASSTNSQLIKWNEEPNNSGGNEHCAEIRTDGTYNDNNCHSKDGYICEVPFVPGSPCFPGWFNCSYGCYYISAANDTVTWSEAGDRCSEMANHYSNDRYSAKGRRLAVNDVKEQACINASLARLPSGSPPYWTDLSDIQVTYIWQFSDPADGPPNKVVLPWAREPNNYKNNENCAVITQGGYYNDYDCKGKALYICEQTLVGTSGTSCLTKGLSLVTMLFACSLANFTL